MPENAEYNNDHWILQTFRGYYVQTTKIKDDIYLKHSLPIIYSSSPDYFSHPSFYFSNVQVENACKFFNYPVIRQLIVILGLESCTFGIWDLGFGIWDLELPPFIA